jgi:hypothetical protein
VNCLGPRPCGSKWDLHTYVRRPPSRVCAHDSCFGGCRDLEGTEATCAWGRPPHILDTLLYGMATNRVSLLHSLPRCIHVCAYLYFFQENKSLQCSTAWIDPLSKPTKGLTAPLTNKISTYCSWNTSYAIWTDKIQTLLFEDHEWTYLKFGSRLSWLFSQ